MNDPVEDFLSADFSGPAAPALRQAVLAETTRLLRRRRAKRRLAWAGALAACFAGGMGTMLLWQNLEPNQEAQRPRTNEDLVAKHREKPAAPPTLPKGTQPAAPLSLLELEWRAFDSRDNRAALFYEVAQRYFEEKDLDAAVRCYRQAFDAAPPEELAIRPDDNWLVMALKEARQKENDNAILTP